MVSTFGPHLWVSSGLQLSLVGIWNAFMLLSLYLMFTVTISLLVWHDANTRGMYRPWAWGVVLFVSFATIFLLGPYGLAVPLFIGVLYLLVRLPEETDLRPAASG